MHRGMNQWTNQDEALNASLNDSMNESMNEWTNQGASMNESRCTSEWANEWNNERINMNQRVNQWTNQWMNPWTIQDASRNVRHSMNDSRCSELLSLACFVRRARCPSKAARRAKHARRWILHDYTHESVYEWITPMNAWINRRGWERR